MSVHGFGVPMPERRRTPRTKLDEIVYVDMGLGNGGVVLNVSEGGLAFCAAIPIRQPGVMQFSLLVKGKGRVASSADVVWTDKRRKTCGLRFTPSFEYSGVLLRHWTDASYCPSRTWDSSSSVTAGVQTLVAPPDASISMPLPAAAPAAARPTSPVSKPERGPFDPITAEDLAAMPQGISTAAEAVLRVAAAFLLFGLVLGTYAYAKRVEDSSFDSVARADAVPSPGVRELKRLAPEPGQMELTAALDFLQRTGTERDTSSAVPLLQTAIRSGNSTGQVVLAEMYLAGDGVRKSCSEGRRLLTAALKNGNPEAKWKLDELDAGSCH